MHQTIFARLFIIVFLFCYAGKVSAQADDKVYYRTHSIRKRNIDPPSAVLVQLRSGSNKLKYFSKHHDVSRYNEVVKEIEAVKKVTINDFQDHFNYCPVYYYIDTNVALIKNQQFDGILLNADGTVATNIKIHAGDTSYLVVFHGYPDENPYSFRVRAIGASDPDYAYGSGYPNGKGLIVLNYEFIQVDFFYVLQGYDLLRKRQPKYEYRAKKFDIDYYALASQFNLDLKRFLPK